MTRKLQLIALLVCFQVLDYFLLEYFASTLWDLLWPRTLIVALLTIVGIFVSRPALMQTPWALAIAHTLATIVGQAFLVHILSGIPVFQTSSFALPYLLSTVGMAGIARLLFERFRKPSLAPATDLFSSTMVLLPALFLIAVLNFLALVYFNTLLWPYLWPKPLIYVPFIGFLVLMIVPGLSKSVWLLRVSGLLLLFTGECYLLHSLQIMVDHFSVLSIIHFVGFTGMFFVIIVNFVNQSIPRNSRLPPPLPDTLPFVAAIVPTYNEPYEVLEPTVRALKNLDYPSDRLVIVIADDGRRRENRDMALLHGVQYVDGPRKDAKAGNLNSALRYLSTYFPRAELILTQDADEMVYPSFLKRTVGYFNDPAVAFVQTPKDVIAPLYDPYGTRDRMFYDVFQVGRNGSNASFACGSGVIWRTSAIAAVGGFDTWNLVEDLTTSYKLHSLGFRSEYHNEVLSIGLAPDDIPGLLKQRGTWAVDTWRLFLFDNPLFKKGLSPAQRLQYTELGLFYATSTFFTPLLMLVPIISLATGQFIPVEGSALFPYVSMMFLYYLVLAKGNGLQLLRMWQYWIGHWPTYSSAFVIALGSRNRKPRYVVTRKTRLSGFYGHYLWAQFLYLGIGFAVIVRALTSVTAANIGTTLTNLGILIFFMLMVSRICRTAFIGAHSIRSHASIQTSDLDGLRSSADNILSHSQRAERMSESR